MRPSCDIVGSAILMGSEQTNGIAQSTAIMPRDMPINGLVVAPAHGRAIEKVRINTHSALQDTILASSLSRPTSRRWRTTAPGDETRPTVAANGENAADAQSPDPRKGLLQETRTFYFCAGNRRR
jgi:hypothetical protein